MGGPHPGKWQFKRCSFGLTQAPAYFQGVVGEVIEGLDFAFGYLDDILMFNPSLEKHLSHCEQVFQRLEKFQLKLSFEKCAFMKKQVQYLGHLISEEGIEQVLGIVAFYRKLLKEPILKYPDTSRPYTLYTDASKFAWAGVLTQAYEHVMEKKTKMVYHHITYLSGLFKGSQLNWATLTKEAYAIYRSVKKLEPHLDWAYTTISSDHLPLKKFLIRDTANYKVKNWAIDLEGFNLNFEYIKGIMSTPADSMSRLVKILYDAKLEPEPEGFEFGELLVRDQPDDEVSEMKKITENKEKALREKQEQDPISDTKILWHMQDEEIARLQRNDPYCRRQLESLQNGHSRKKVFLLYEQRAIT